MNWCYLLYLYTRLPTACLLSQIDRLMGPTWGPPGSCRPQVSPTLAPWTLLSGMLCYLTARGLCYQSDLMLSQAMDSGSAAFKLWGYWLKCLLATASDYSGLLTTDLLHDTPDAFIHVFRRRSMENIPRRDKSFLTVVTLADTRWDWRTRAK